MTDKELIKKLKDCDLTPETTSDIAKRMEQLIALNENGQSAIDTNKRLTNKLQMALDDMKSLIQDDGYCKLCVYFVECKGNKCSGYFEYNEVTDENGKVIPWKGDCRDFSWGDCPLQEDKPCRNCKNASEFKWRGDV